MKILTAVVNNPTFIEIQYYTLKKFMSTPYEFIVFNDAKDFPDYTNDGDVTIKTKIIHLCEKLNIQCINIPNEHHRADQRDANRCADSMNFILEYQKKNLDKYLLLDSDMFLINHFDIKKYENSVCAVVLQSRFDHTYNYFWNGIYYFDMTKMENQHLLNWDCGNADVGGMMKDWLSSQCNNLPNVDEIRRSKKDYSRDNIFFIRHLWSCTWNEEEIPIELKHKQWLIDILTKDNRNQNGNFFCEIYDDVFLHYRAGGNWRKEGVSQHNSSAEAWKVCLMEKDN